MATIMAEAIKASDLMKVMVKVAKDLRRGRLQMSTIQRPCDCVERVNEREILKSAN